MTNSTMPRLTIIQPVRSGQTTEQVVARVYELIKRDELKPGDRLPPERELAKQLGISRPSLRAGLSSLISMGVLQSRQGAGTFIVDGPPALDSEPLRLLAQLHGFSYDHMFETRSFLEVGAAGLAAERATGEQLATMSEEIAEMFVALKDPQQFLLHDITFHRAVAAASGNPTLATATRSNVLMTLTKRLTYTDVYIEPFVHANPTKREKQCENTSYALRGLSH